MDKAQILTIAVIALAAVSLLLLVLTVFVIIRLAEMRKTQANVDKHMELLPLLYSKLDNEAKARTLADADQTDRINAFVNSSLKEQAEQSRRINDTLSALTRQTGEENRRMQELLQTNLEQIRASVDEKLTSTLSSRLDLSFKTVSEQLENVYKSLGEMKELSGSVTQGVTGLTRVLSNVKSRGTWGETQLKAILDDIVPTLYETNVATDKNSQKRVEFAVKVIGDNGETVLMPLDSKFPTEDYARLCDAAEQGDAQGLQEARKALFARVQNEARAVAEYIHEPETTPFAVMYLATEGLYAEVAANDVLLSRMRSEQKVMICGPTTVAALLNSLALGMRTVTINRKAEEIRGLLVNIRAQYVKFSDLLAKTRGKLAEAEKALGEAEKRNGLIYKKLESVEAPAGAAEAQAELFDSELDNAQALPGSEE